MVAHDWLCGVRGGEHVLERVCALVEREFEPAGLLTMFDDGSAIGQTVDAWVSGGLRRVSSLNGIFRSAPRIRRWLLPLYPLAIWHLNRSLARIHGQQPVDLLVSTSSAAIKGLRPPPGVPHLCVCFSPARYVWGDGDEYRADGSVSGLLREFGLRAFSPVFRAWDWRTARNVTAFAAISRHIRDRIRSAYGAPSTILFPPVRTEFFTPDAAVAREDFWLCVGALEPYKRVDLAIDAARLAGVALKIAGVGSQSAHLQRAAAGDPRIQFLGRVPDQELRSLYRRAGLLVFPQVEDFGIVPLEAQACGLPVVARDQGGSLDTVLDGSTGALFHGADARAIVDAAARVSADPAACRANAERFSETRFDREFLELIRSVLPAASPGANPKSIDDPAPAPPRR